MRLERAVTEVGLAENYEYEVVNETDHSEECAQQIKSIITAEHLSYGMMKGTVERYTAE